MYDLSGSKEKNMKQIFGGYMFGVRRDEIVTRQPWKNVTVAKEVAYYYWIFKQIIYHCSGVDEVKSIM